MITVDSNRVTYSLVYRDASHTTRNIFDLNTQLYKHLSFKHRSLELDWLTGWHIKQTAVSNLNLYWIKGALLCFSFWLHVLDSAVYSAFESTLNSSIVSYRIVFKVTCMLSYRIWLLRYDWLRYYHAAESENSSKKEATSSGQSVVNWTGVRQMKVSGGDINETSRQPNSRLLQNNWLTLTQLHQQNHKSERVSRFLTARQHN